MKITLKPEITHEVTYKKYLGNTFYMYVFKPGETLTVEEEKVWKDIELTFAKYLVFEDEIENEKSVAVLIEDVKDIKIDPPVEIKPEEVTQPVTEMSSSMEDTLTVVEDTPEEVFEEKVEDAPKVRGRKKKDS